MRRGPHVIARPNSVRRVRSAEMPGTRSRPSTFSSGRSSCHLEAIAKSQRRPFLDGHPQPDRRRVAGSLQRLDTDVNTPEEAAFEQPPPGLEPVRRPEGVARLQPERPARDISSHLSQAIHGDLLDDLPRTFTDRKDHVDLRRRTGESSRAT